VGKLLEAIKQGTAEPEIAVEVDEIARRFGVVTEFTRVATDAAGDTHLG
jgi:hypothetical protein